MKYRQKFVIIEALEWTGENHREMWDFLTGTKDKSIQAFAETFYIHHSKVRGGLIIKTLEGEHQASIGDFLIKGVHGEFYLCKPDIFRATYEKVEG